MFRLLLTPTTNLLMYRHEPGGKILKINTRLFGELEYQEEDLISFPDGLPSFENEHSFLILPLAGSENSIFCLQSTVTPSLSFIMMDPCALDPHYSPIVKGEDLKTLHVSSNLDLCYYVLCAMKRPASETTVNLKCPIALEPKAGLAFQVILENENLSMHHMLSEFAHQKEGTTC